MSSKSTGPTGRIDRIVTRLPRFLRRYVEPLRNAPLTHVSAFLLLHELTAIVPLFGLAGLFHYYDYLPPYITDGDLVAQGVKRFGNYFRRKGWIEELNEDASGEQSQGAVRWSGGEGSVRIVTEFATAYAITKVLLPLRLVLSMWATPWFARVLVTPFTNFFSKVFKKVPKASNSVSKGATLPPTTGNTSSAGVHKPRASETRAK